MVVKDCVGEPIARSDTSNNQIKCLLCNGSAVTQSHCVADLPFYKSKSSNTPLLDLLYQIIGRDAGIRRSDYLCMSCCEVLNQIDCFNTSAKQLQHQLLLRFEERRRSVGVTAQCSTSQCPPAATARQPFSAPEIAMSPNLSVTVMRGPIPKRRRYGVPEEEYLSSAHRRHCCDSFCSHVDLPRKQPSHQFPDVTNQHSSSKMTVQQTYSNIQERSIKCSVGDLDKSHIASILHTPTRNAQSIPGVANSSHIVGNSPEPSSQTYKLNEPNTLLQNSLEYLNKSSSQSMINVKKSVSSNALPNRVINEPVQVVCALPDTEDENSTDSDTDSEDCGTLQLAVHQKTAEQDPVGMSTAMLLNNPVASSLLHSFLATSLWLQGGTNPQHPLPQQHSNTLTENNEHDSDGPQPDPVNEDMTCESLSVSCGVQDKNTRQELKNTGQSYINTKGKMVEAKRVAPQDCSKCVMRCGAKLSECDRQSVFGEFWGLADYTRQREYLAEHMHREEKLGPSGLTRTVVLYYLTHHKKVQVCRQFFLKTLDVSEKASRIVLEKKVRGEFGDIGAPPPPPTHRTTSSRSRRTVANNQDSDYEY